MEAVLRDKDYSVSMLLNTYKEYPSNLIKIAVANKNRFLTNEDQTKLIEPTRLQDVIEIFSKDKAGGRAFVRPSGTEDFLRLYVECKDKEDLNTLTDIIKDEIE